LLSVVGRVFESRDVHSGSFAASESVRSCEVNGMNPLKEDKENRGEKHDRADEEETRLVPPDIDIEEGDEEKNEETDMPPAMPPKV
jgi:hypothetical protein